MLVVSPSSSLSTLGGGFPTFGDAGGGGAGRASGGFFGPLAVGGSGRRGGSLGRTLGMVVTTLSSRESSGDPLRVTLTEASGDMLTEAIVEAGEGVTRKASSLGLRTGGGAGTRSRSAMISLAGTDTTTAGSSSGTTLRGVSTYTEMTGSGKGLLGFVFSFLLGLTLRGDSDGFGFSTSTKGGG